MYAPLKPLHDDIQVNQVNVELKKVLDSNILNNFRFLILVILYGFQLELYID